MKRRLISVVLAFAEVTAEFTKTLSPGLRVRVTELSSNSDRLTLSYACTKCLDKYPTVYLMAASYSESGKLLGTVISSLSDADQSNVAGFVELPTAAEGKTSWKFFVIDGTGWYPVAAAVKLK